MKKIRQELGLSQQDLALLLNVSRSAISMYEKGFRPLPAKAAEKWTALQRLWQEQRQKTLLPRNIEKSFLQVQQRESLSLLNIQAQKAAALSVRLTQQVARLEEKHNRMFKKLHLIKGLMRDTPKGSREMELLKNREQRTLISLAACSPERRQLLAYKLQVLHSQQKAALAGKVVVQQQAAL